ncbi:hypothetical protein [Rodentibacter sp. Ppn85]|uniref:hypothetical protein n=1 Tax=Rodentibacter sp. Ppn85 TaxID=1908525 RepID=UPI001E2B8948|nr:hypothetical protein [Rodentibacter sp. Ppn85]
MNHYSIGKVSFSDRNSLAQIDALLEQEGIRRDPNLDYLCAMFDEDFNIIAMGLVLVILCAAWRCLNPIKGKA